jgi:hypothetical protein
MELDSISRRTVRLSVASDRDDVGSLRQKQIPFGDDKQEGQEQVQRQQVLCFQEMSSVRLESGCFEIDVLPFAALDAGADLAGSLALLGLLVGVYRFLHAGRARCAVSSFKAAVEAVVSHCPVAVAVAGLLVQDFGDLCRHLVGGHLIGVGEIDSG